MREATFCSLPRGLLRRRSHEPWPQSKRPRDAKRPSCASEIRPQARGRRTAGVAAPISLRARAIDTQSSVTTGSDGSLRTFPAQWLQRFATRAPGVHDSLVIARHTGASSPAGPTLRSRNLAPETPGLPPSIGWNKIETKPSPSYTSRGPSRGVARRRQPLHPLLRDAAGGWREPAPGDRFRREAATALHERPNLCKFTHPYPFCHSFARVTLAPSFSGCDAV